MTRKEVILCHLFLKGALFKRHAIYLDIFAQANCANPDQTAKVAVLPGFTLFAIRSLSVSPL